MRLSAARGLVPSGPSPWIALLLPPLLAGCVREFEPPFVGDCAIYPDKLYDYGDIGIGSCLSGPVDLMALSDPEGLGDGGWTLFVSNANPSVLFTSGSILPLDGAELERIAAEGGVHTIDEIAPPEAGLSVRSFSGSMAWDPARFALYYTNRLSYSTETEVEDRIEGAQLSGGVLTPVDTFDAEAGDTTYAIVGEDPFAIARHDQTGRLYVVNESSQDMTLLDTLAADAETLRYTRTVMGARAPSPEFEDAGPPSLLEAIFTAYDASTLPADDFSLTWLDPQRRFLYPVVVDGVTALALADSHDGVRWLPEGSGAVLRPGEGDTAWDRGGLGAGAVLLDGESWVLLYEGQGGGRHGIGLATSGTWPGEWEKYDNGVAADPADDAVLVPGPDSFDQGGVGAPSVMRPDGVTFRLWYNAVGADGRTRIAAARGDNAVEWEKQGVALEASAAGESVGDPVVALRSGGGFQLFYVEGDFGASTCLRYAESSDGGLTFTPGGESGQAPGCLLSEADGLPPILRRPVMVSAVDQVRMWFSAADSPEGPWRTFMARSFDQLSWEVLGEVEVLPAPTGFESLSPDLFATTGVPTSEIYGSWRVEREAFGVVSVGTAPGSLYTIGGLTMTVLAGHTLAAPNAAVRWWGSPDTRAVDQGVVLGEPAVLPEADRLWMSATVGEGASRLGVAYPSAGGIPGSSWALPDGGVGEITGLKAEGTASVRGPWLVRPGADPDVIWLYFGEALEDGSSWIGRSVSVDGGSTWSDPDRVLEGGDGLVVTDPSVVRGADGRYHLWYTAAPAGTAEIRHASSSDGLDFVSEEGGGLLVGEPGSWDDGAVSSPSVVWDAEAGLYRMWYTGNDGSRERIGYATGEVSGGEITWSRYRDPTSGLRVSVWASSTTGWDGAGVSHPMVLQEGADVFRMWFQGRYDDETARIGYATSRDGSTWSPVAPVPTNGDTVTLSTAPGREVDSDDPKAGATVSLNMGSTAADGSTTTDITFVPVDVGDGVILQCFAVVTSRSRPAVYLIDTYDDSAAANGGKRAGPCVKATNPELYKTSDPTFVDSNYDRVEAVFQLQNNLSSSSRGTRRVAFSPDGRRMYLTSPGPAALLVVDTAWFEDDLALQIDGVLPVLGFVELARGGGPATDDPDNGTGLQDYSADIGPTGLAVSPIDGGRYLFVANGNDHSVYTIDTTLGAYGQVVAVAPAVGDVPYDVALSPSARHLFVGNYAGQVEGQVANSTMAILDADPTSATFGQVVATLVNREL